MAEPILLKPTSATDNPGGPENTTADAPGDKEFIDAKTAFLIFIQEDGTVVMSPNLDVPVVTERQPTVNDVFSACGVVMKDIQNQESAALAAQFVMNSQMQLAQKMREAQLNQQAMQGLQLR